MTTLFPVIETVSDAPRQVIAAAADASFLRLPVAPELPADQRPVRLVDLFSSCGFMSLGVREACRAIGRGLEIVLAVDVNQPALDVYGLNFGGRATRCAAIETLLDGKLGTEPTEREQRLIAEVGDVDLLVGGPPCQGHSDLNNHTRRRDPKNRLYNRMARFAELVLPTHVIVENVPAVVNDRGRVLEQTKLSLINAGYEVDDGVVDLVDLGVPQRRRRHVLLASRLRQPSLATDLARYAVSVRSVRWAIEDLVDVSPDQSLDRPSKTHPRNRRRIDYLFDTNVYDLPNSMRPACHRLRPDHSYKSVYGRLSWDKPSQTITSGFGCMGQGRYAHPSRRRTLTPHEAARLQFIPDFFCFGSDASRRGLSEMIGNAVPPKLTYVLATELLR